MKRPLKKHAEMETLFGADFLPLSKRALAAKAAAPSPSISKEAPPAP